MKTSTNTKGNFFNAFYKLFSSVALILFCKMCFAQVEPTWNKGAFIFPEDLAKEFGTPIGNVWHSPNSVDKYYCQNLNGRNANAKSKIHS